MIFNQRSLIPALFAILAHTTAGAADQPRIADIPQISVTGYAHERLVPDEAKLVAVMTGNGATPDAAIRDLEMTMTKVIDVVRKAGIADGDTESSGPDIAPLYKHYYDAQGHEIMEKREPNGFRATFRLTASTKSTETLGKLVPAVTSAGATIDSVSFDISELTSVRLALEEKAVTEAVARAKRQIIAAGMKPGRVLTIGELPATQVPAPKVFRMAAAPMAAPPPPPTEFTFALRPGKQDVEVERQVVMEMLSE